MPQTSQSSTHFIPPAIIGSTSSITSPSTDLHMESNSNTSSPPSPRVTNQPPRRTNIKVVSVSGGRDMIIPSLRPHDICFYKVNTDAAIDDSRKRSGSGAVIRDLKMLFICRDTEVLPGQTSSRVTPAEKDGRGSEGEKASGTRRVYELVTFILIMHTYGYVNEVEQYVKEIDGVESVKSDINSNKLEVKGKVDPVKIQKMVKRKTKTNVKLIFPLPEIESYGDENECPEEKLEEKTRPADIANKKIEESVTVLKIKLCCDSCNQKLQKNLKAKRLEMVAMDKEEDLVTVKGTVNMTELRSYIKRVLKKDIEVVVPVNKETVATEKKGRETGAIGKKEKDTGAVDKILREKETEPRARGRAGVENKSENKDSGVNQKKEKDKDVGHRKIEDASSDGSSRGNYQEGGINVTTKPNLPYYHSRPVDNVYDYTSCDRYVHSHSVYRSNGYDMFSDENPHSYCTIM
ncbi:hypothetical protein EZV62_016290 [Acer yangbiense]|uniref:HMA domain-containing protein n=1 Tax=Acer yangbiense TaxID=1000413 RepID=A0A5C7HN90_9ROSI|nr:hypothetical protein EZV62_016290 [Acer yangbiense]